MANQKTMAAAARGLFGAFCAAAAMAAHGAPVAINFDNIGSGVAVDANYAALGVSSGNASTLNVPGLTGSTAPNAIVHTTLVLLPTPADPIQLFFSADVSVVTIDALDAGENGAWLRAFDIGGSLLGDHQFVGANRGTGSVVSLTVGAAGIRRVDLSRVNDIDGTFGDGVVFDNLRFTIASTPMPEPSSLALAVLALGGAAAMRRRRASR